MSEMRQTWSSSKVFSYTTSLLLAKAVDQKYLYGRKSHYTAKIAKYAHIKSKNYQKQAIFRITKLIGEKLRMKSLQSNPNHPQFSWNPPPPHLI